MLEGNRESPGFMRRTDTLILSIGLVRCHIDCGHELHEVRAIHSPGNGGADIAMNYHFVVHIWFDCSSIEFYESDFHCVLYIVACRVRYCISTLVEGWVGIAFFSPDLHLGPISPGCFLRGWVDPDSRPTDPPIQRRPVTRRSSAACCHRRHG